MWKVAYITMYALSYQFALNLYDLTVCYVPVILHYTILLFSV